MRRLLFYMVYFLLTPGLIPAQQAFTGQPSGGSSSRSSSSASSSALSLSSTNSSSPSVPSSPSGSSRSVLWHGQQRSLRYRPDGSDFVIVNGTHRFNRALYGTNTAFRVEGGDLPEFALYMPGMGGNLRFGILRGDSSKWLIDAKYIKAVYRPGSLLYEIKDPLLGDGTLHITVLALANAEGMIIKMTPEGIDRRTRLCWAFGGATGKKFSRDGDLGADPESSFDCQPEYCRGDHYSIIKNSFQLTYDGSRTLEGIFPPGAELRLADATRQGSPSELLHSGASATPVVTGSLSSGFSSPGPSGNRYFLIRNPASDPTSAPASAPTSATSPTAVSISQTPTLIISTNNVSSFASLKLLRRFQNSKFKIQNNLSTLFDQAERARQKIAGRVQVNTPDPYINTLGGALSIAADAIWEDPSYLHGAVAWRMRLNAWRGPYVADPLGWHDRAERHFSSYALSQITTPDSGPVVADTALHLARQLEKLGTSLFSSGYICRNPGGDLRPHHYDMNLVFIDQLLDHFYWTGDTAFVRKMWPVLQRHLAWEKRNFDMDGDGLYDAYCCIWASDALQYSGGGVTHSSAYNYRANKVAAELAVLIGEDPAPYRKEADKILHAINTELWLPAKGWYAEYIDRVPSPVTSSPGASSSAGLSPRIIHPAAALWTIYHAIDSHVPDPFQAWQSLRYIDTDIPHIPIRAQGLDDTSLYTLSTTNWQPYTWSINNVVMAESLHTALAYWQGGRPDAAWPLWKGALVESMYLGGSPGNFQQLSFYDAMRGELYRDFADPIGMAARSLVEGLFGIRPDALHDTLTIQPGWPLNWQHASLHIPDISVDYAQNGNKDRYTIIPAFAGKMNLQLKLRARSDVPSSVTVNGRPARWTNVDAAVGAPLLQVIAAPAAAYHIEITWKMSADDQLPAPAPMLSDEEGTSLAEGEPLAVKMGKAKITGIYDPQGALNDAGFTEHGLHATVRAGQGNKTIFVALQQGPFHWWRPVYFKVIPPVELTIPPDQPADHMLVWVTNHTSFPQSGRLLLNYGTGKYSIPVSVRAKSSIDATSMDTRFNLPSGWLQNGTNNIRFDNDKGLTAEATLTDWNAPPVPGEKYDTVGLSAYFNDRVTQIFRNRYLSPRPASPTLQLPIQGIGNWCYPLTTANIDDAGLRAVAGSNNNNEIFLPQGIPLATPGTKDTAKGLPETSNIVPEPPNIVFTSRWDNYPDSVAIPLTGKASHAYFLLAGSTDPMQSHITNGMIDILYKDGSADSLPLINPSTWWPVEQDYYEDGFAFTTGAPRPLRVYLKTGIVSGQRGKWTTIKGFSNTAIDGGAATVLDLPLHPEKELDRMVLRTLAGDVVIGLMSLTLLRNEKN